MFNWCLKQKKTIGMLLYDGSMEVKFWGTGDGEIYFWDIEADLVILITSISILFLFLPILLLEPISRNLTLSLNLDLFSKLIFRKIVEIPDWALRSYTSMERTLSSIKSPVESPEGRKKSKKGMWVSCGLLATTEWSHLGFLAHPGNP